MKLLFELLPVLLFFISYKIAGIYVATGVAIATAVIQIAIAGLRGKSITNMQWVTVVLLILFGGMTIIFQDSTFIKWKPTIVNWLFAAAFLIAPFVSSKSFPQRMMENSVSLLQEQWQILNISWVLFFVASGIINILVAYNFSEETWVNFKLFGLMGMTFLFVLAQGIYISRITQTMEENS
jgi:intracellular septation protein